MEEGRVAHNLECQKRTEDVRLKELAPFSKMMLSSAARRGLQQAGFVYPTVIQATAIPVGKSGLDLLVQSKSGTGKTLIAGVILLEAYQSNVTEPQSLIIAPTREIAVQIADVLNQIGHFCVGFRAVAVIGGMDVVEDRKRLQGAKAVVGTPGRLLHVLQNAVLNCSQIKLIVLDEADKLYTQSFRQDLQRIIKSIPAQCQTIACSATFCNGLDQEIAKIMRNPLLISTEDRATLLVGIKQYALELEEQKTSILEMQSKLDALREIFGRIPFKQCVVFASSQSRADSYRNYLEKDGWPCELMSGAQDQRNRLEVFRKFREFKIRILVATDLMSRGVDSEHVNLVINLELPTDIVTYLHRIGRAGRFGSHGIAISFIASEKDRDCFKRFNTGLNSGMNVLKFPRKMAENDNYDFWNFSNFAAECQQLGVFNQATAPLASQDHSTSSLTDTQDDKENRTENICNSYTSIDTKTFQVDSKDSALNMQDLNVDATDQQENTQRHQALTSDSRNSSTQQLPSSNTIDDASSIAADSVRSSQQDISRYQSVLMQKVAIPTLVEFLVDPNSQDEQQQLPDVKRKTKLNINVFEDYRKSVLNKDLPSLDEESVKDDAKPLANNNISQYKNLLIDKPTKENTTLKTSKQNHLYSDYANFNEQEDDSSSISNATPADDPNKSTFILSVATPSNAHESLEELQNSLLDLSQAGSTSYTESLPEKQHFPSPACIEAVNIANAMPSKQDMKSQKLTINVAAQIEIPPYERPRGMPLPLNAAPLNGNEESASSGSESLRDNEELVESGSNTERDGGSSGFNEKTTSASSGIESSDTEIKDNGECVEGEDEDDDDEDDEDYDPNLEVDFGELSDDESCDYEETLNGEEYVETENEDLSEMNAEEEEANIPTCSLNNSFRSHATTNNTNSLAYQSAYATWVNVYRQQVNMLQEYVQMCSATRGNLRRDKK